MMDDGWMLLDFCPYIFGGVPSFGTYIDGKPTKNNNYVPVLYCY